MAINAHGPSLVASKPGPRAVGNAIPFPYMHASSLPCFPTSAPPAIRAVDAQRGSCGSSVISDDLRTSIFSPYRNLVP